MNSVRNAAGLVSIFFLLAACGGGGGDGQTSSGSGGEVSQATLVNGGMVVGTDGVTIAALAKTLTSPIDVFISETAAPAESLPADTRALGKYYQLLADTASMVPTTSPFVLSFPVPAGADTARLALGVRVPGDRSLDAGRSGWEWQFLYGRYDAARNTFLATIPFLSDAGRIFVLAQSDDFESPPTGAAPVAGSFRVAAASTIASPGEGIIMQGVDFYVRCRHLPPLSCTDAMKQGLADRLEETRAELILQGFKEPRLPVQMEDIGLSSGDFIGLGYVVILARSGSDHCLDSNGRAVSGLYDPETGHLTVCVAGPDVAGGFPHASISTARHEYFHATQYAYTDVVRTWLDGAEVEWFIEGTAAAAEFSYIDESAGAPQRMYLNGKWSIRRLDVEMSASQNDATYRDNVYEYEAQDFWVFAGRKFGQDLNSVIPILTAGATLEAIDTGLFGDSLKGMYWSWVKDQSFEHQVDLEPDALHSTVPACHLGPGVFESRSNESFLYGLPWYWFPITAPFAFEGTVKPLSTALVRIVPVDQFPTRMTIWEVNSQTDSDIAYKVYLDQEADCLTAPDGLRTFDPTVAPHDDIFYFVLIANLSATQEKRFRLVGHGVR
ncbi:MAG TPA: hypothetical protein VJS66_08260 [Burkholderiales bacterium]|nr:hypothetical protein [Burkholderiales bacterium]